MRRVFLPDFVVDSVECLSPQFLGSLGLRALLLDVDCTLKPYRAPSIAPEVVQWVDLLRESGFGLCLVSNGRLRRVMPLAQQLGLPYIAPAWKPFPFALWRAVRWLGSERNSTAMVGDQIFADVLAARLAGLRSILVTPIFPDQEPWWTRLKRPLETLVTGKKGLEARRSPARLTG
jgi:HAD superfamily phosphatase (TIGR01668 family)